MRRKWISPFDMYESLMWRNKQKRKTDKPVESEKNETRRDREEVGNGAGNTLLIMKETFIRKELTSEREEKLQERE